MEHFFIKKVNISSSKDIGQIIRQIHDIKEKNDDYFDLLIDLNGLIDDSNELDKYYDSYEGKLPINRTESKKFIVENEKIFILDNGEKNNNRDFYFNDLNVNNYDKLLKGKIFSVNKKYPVNHYSTLIN